MARHGIGNQKEREKKEKEIKEEEREREGKTFFSIDWRKGRKKEEIDVGGRNFLLSRIVLRT